MASEHDKNQDEISLIDLFAVLFRYKIIIISVTLFAAVFIVIYSLISIKMPPEKSYMPNVYKSKALMLINDSSNSDSSALSALASGSAGGLASMLEISGGGKFSNSKLAVFLAGSDSFLDAIAEEFDLIRTYKLKSFPKTSVRKILKSKLKAVLDDKTGVFILSFEDINPEFAKDVVVFCVNYYERKFSELGLDKDIIEKTNLEKSIESTLQEIENIRVKIRNLENGSSYFSSIRDIAAEAEMYKIEFDAQKLIYTQLKAKYEMLRIKMNSERPVFSILEMPEVPEQKSGPSRAKLCILVTFAAFFLSVFFVFLLNAIKQLKEDSSVVKKFSKGYENEKK